MDTTTAVPATIAQPLTGALAAFDAEEAELQAKLNDLAHRRELVQQAMASTNGNGSQSDVPPLAVAETLSISPEREKAVQKYLEKHPRARQATIAKGVRLKGQPINGGSVSTALRRLEAAGLIERTDEKEDGSLIWIMPSKLPTV